MMMTNSVYHFVGRTPDREAFRTHINTMWQQSLEDISSRSLRQNLRVHAYVLMPNHFHLLVETVKPELDLECFSGLEMVHEKILNAHVYRETYRYITLNPVRGGLCKLPYQYPYSTYSYHYKTASMPFLLYSRLSFAFGGLEGELQWILK